MTYNCLNNQNCSIYYHNSQFPSFWLPNLRRLYLVAYLVRQFDFPRCNRSRPKYLFTKKFWVYLLPVRKFWEPKLGKFSKIWRSNLNFFGQSWVLSKTTLPIINNIPNAIMCDKKTIYVQFRKLICKFPIGNQNTWR